MMHSALQKSGPSPYFLSLMAGALLIAVTAYPKSLDESAFCKEKAGAAQCAPSTSKCATALHK